MPFDIKTIITVFFVTFEAFRLQVCEGSTVFAYLNRFVSWKERRMLVTQVKEGEYL